MARPDAGPPGRSGHRAEAGEAPPRPPPPPRAAPRHTAFPDDWFLRRGTFERGAIHDAAWQAELDVVTRWLDGLPLGGTIDEPAAGTGFFSPLLAEKGELHASDEDGAALDLARERLVAHRLRAHLHEADPWASAAGRRGGRGRRQLPRRTGARRRAGRRRRRRSGPGFGPAGCLALVDLRPDPAGGPPDGVAWTWHDPAILEAALARAGFVDVTATDDGPLLPPA